MKTFYIYSLCFFALIGLYSCNAGKTVMDDSNTKQVQVPVEEIKKEETPEVISFNPSFISGKWQAVDDKKSTIEFNNSLKIDYYDGVKMSEGSYSLMENILTIQDTEIADPFLYTVYELSEEKLVINYTVKGNTLEYTKIQD